MLVSRDHLCRWCRYSVLRIEWRAVVNYANKKKRFRVGSLACASHRILRIRHRTRPCARTSDNAIRSVTVQNSKTSFLLECTFDGAGATEFVCPLISLSRIYWPASERDTIVKLLSHSLMPFNTLVIKAIGSRLSLFCRIQAESVH